MNKTDFGAAFLLIKEIDEQRQNLHKILEHQDLSSDNVLEESERLDEIIVRYYRQVQRIAV